MNLFFFKDRDGQTPLPEELRSGLKFKHIQSTGELDEVEEQSIAEGLLWLAQQKSREMTYPFWMKLHRKLLGNVWSWAGKTRTHDLANPDFISHLQIWTELKKLEEDLASWIHNQYFSEREIAARFHERLLTIHPFPNGNGRFSRILVEYLSREINWDVPTWGKRLTSDPKARRASYISAIIIARHKRDFTPLVAFIYS